MQIQKLCGLKMPLSDLYPPLVVVVGPTAVGKTALSIELARRLGGEIVSADSRLFYRGMDIGTAKPSPQERAQIPHHLIDVAAIDEPWSLALFQKAAKEAIHQIHQRHKLPFLVGGSGQYIQAVVDEWQIPEQLPDFRLRETLEVWGKELGAAELHRRLALVDAEAAARIEPNNLRRSVRALEVIFHTGQKFSAQRKKGQSPYRVFQLGLGRPRPEVYRRIDQRIEQMISAGLLAEVQGLLAQGYPAESPPFSAIGYREMLQVLRGDLTVDEAVVLMKRATRQFVRRQYNWFKLEDPTIHWFDLEQVKVEEIETAVRAWLQVE
jgi:tRNA dimethylallyltransferase